jgi:hypothetical protein
VIQSEFDNGESSESIGFSHCQLRLVVQALDDAAGELLLMTSNLGAAIRNAVPGSIWRAGQDEQGGNQRKGPINIELDQGALQGFMYGRSSEAPSEPRGAHIDPALAPDEPIQRLGIGLVRRRVKARMFAWRLYQK